MTNGEYYYKTITYRHDGKDLNFQVAQSLFSSYQIDIGTQFLLRTIKRFDFGNNRRILDIGCGYGPIGIVLKESYPDSAVHMVDRDALAVNFTRNNAEINGVGDVCIYPSLDYGSVHQTDFDLILSNIPAKAGTPVIARILLGAAPYLCPGGQVAVVVVRPLEYLVDTLFQDNPNVSLIGKHLRKGHIVYIYEFTGDSDHPRNISLTAFKKNVYERDRRIMTFGDITYPMTMAYGLAEFDTYDYRTIILMKMLFTLNSTTVKRVLAFNPGQGHVPVIIRHSLKPDHIVISDRDLLSVENTKINLLDNDFPEDGITALNQVDIRIDDEKTMDIVVGVFRSDETDEANYMKISRSAGLLAEHGRIIVSGTSTEISRLERKLNKTRLLTTVAKKKSNRCSVIVLKKRK